MPFFFLNLSRAIGGRLKKVAFRLAHLDRVPDLPPAVLLSPARSWPTSLRLLCGTRR